MKIKGREILIYCFLAYLFSWTYWLTGMLGRNPVHPFNSLGGYGISVGMFGPMLAAVIMRGFISKEGFKGSVGVIRPFKFYVIAYLVPFFFILALIMFNNITGIGRILGLIWACWHLPPLTLAHDSLWLSIPVFLAGAILVTFPFTWLYRASGASVLVVSLFHSSYDLWGDNFTTAETYPGQTQLLVGDTGLICISFLLVIVVLKYIVFGVPAKVHGTS